MLYNLILKEYQKLQIKIRSLEEQLKSFPSGKLICCHQKNRCKWYQSDGHKKTYIPKSNRTFAEQLAIKKYLTYTLEELAHEKTALEFYLNHHQTTVSKANQLLTEASGYQELLSPFFTPVSTELTAWMNHPYETNLEYPEHLIHKTSSGHLVRSKSEAMISHVLYTQNIPFRYEALLTLDHMNLYPDFTIRHPRTGETFYWEHFGLMDDPAYCKNAASKLQLFSSHGIVPMIQLITTYETQKSPLTIDVIEKIVEHFFS